MQLDADFSVILEVAGMGDGICDALPKREVWIRVRGCWKVLLCPVLDVVAEIGVEQAGNRCKVLIAFRNTLCAVFDDAEPAIAEEYPSYVGRCYAKAAQDLAWRQVARRRKLPRLLLSDLLREQPREFSVEPNNHPAPEA